MKKKPIYILLIALGQTVFGQTVSKQIVGAAGTTQSNGDVRLSWTAGEPIVGLMSSGGTQLGSGYYSSMDIKALSTEEFTMDVAIKVYPNPTTQYLYAEQQDNHQMEIRLIDLGGKTLFTKKVNSKEAIDVSGFVTGLYLIELRDAETNKKNTYKIIKK